MTLNKFTSGSHEIVLKRIRDIPSLPEVVTRIVEKMGNPNVPASEIARLISYDPGLTSRVLRMVNSAAYGFQRQISSIQHGIALLGFNTVRGLVLSASILKMFEEKSGSEGLDHRAFWKHSMMTAVASRMLAREFRIPETDDAFSAGMLHDIGKVVLDVYFRHDYAGVLQLSKRQKVGWHGTAFCGMEAMALGVTHCDIGSFLAAKWKLPVGISEVIEFHHRPQDAERCPELVHLVALANQLAVILAEHPEIAQTGTLQPDMLDQTVLDYFNIDETSIPRLLDRLKTETESLQELQQWLTAG